MVRDLLEQGSGDAAIIFEARAFYARAQQMPRRPPGPANAHDEIALWAPALTNVRNRVPYRGVELDAIEFLLKPGERIISHSESAIATTSKLIDRRILPDVNKPGAMIDAYDERWRGQFPSPSEYAEDGTPRPQDGTPPEGDDEPARWLTKGPAGDQVTTNERGKPEVIHK
jgi:hypothetical protein